MKNKFIVRQGVDSRNGVFLGMSKLADTLRVAIGPYGLNMISGIVGGEPMVSNDAKEIADKFVVKDEIEDVGVRLLRESIHKANDLAGNGRKTCALLTQAIAKEMFKYLPSEKISIGRKPIRQVLKMVEEETKQALTHLSSMSEKVTTKEQLVDIAITACGDEEIGKLIGETQWELGKEGTIIAEETADPKSSMELVKGIRIDNGFGAALMMNNLSRQTLEVDNAKLFLTNHVINKIEQVRPLIDSLIYSGTRDFIIVARAFTSEAIKECQDYHSRGFRLYPVNAPYTNQTQVMLDIASTTGATYIHEESRDLGDIQVSDVGFVKRMEAGRYSTTFTGLETEQTKKNIAKRIDDLEKEYEGEKSVFSKRMLEERISQLKSGFAIIKIGSLTAGNRKYKFDKASDAIKTTKGAFIEGMVSGGGKALKDVSDLMPDGSILKLALKAPYEQIMVNAGEEIDIPVSVKDSVKVLRIGLEHASHIASTAATIGIAINVENEKPRYMQEARVEEQE